MCVQYIRRCSVYRGGGGGGEGGEPRLCQGDIVSTWNIRLDNLSSQASILMIYLNVLGWS